MPTNRPLGRANYRWIKTETVECCKNCTHAELSTAYGEPRYFCRANLEKVVGDSYIRPVVAPWGLCDKFEKGDPT